MEHAGGRLSQALELGETYVWDDPEGPEVWMVVRSWDDWHLIIAVGVKTAKTFKLPAHLKYFVGE